MHKKYFVRIIITAFVMLTFVSAVNWIYDPGDIYLQNYLMNRHIDDYTDKLISAQVGIEQYANERKVKFSLLQKSDQYDCILLGSSRIMQLSTLREPSSLMSLCSSSMNLGVSGHSFEDLLILSYNVLHHINPPKKIIIGIDPWGLKWNSDSRYSIYGEYLPLMKKELGVAHTSSGESYVTKLLKNSISYEYFIESVKRALKVDFRIFPNRFEGYNLQQVPVFDYSEGYLYRVTLADGSHVYDKDWISRHKTSESYIKDGDYKKIEGTPYDADLIGIFRKLLIRYRELGFQVYVVLTPYHHSVFRAENKKNFTSFLEVENQTKILASELKIPVYGSFNPMNVGCLPDEFYDFMHPMKTCLDRIEFQ
jgi:hypothetical protein